jgi:CheY-like chemotaxis protein
MQPEQSAGTVLIVDDDQRERGFLVEIISSLGYNTEIAADGEEALRKLDSVTVAAIVTDLMMPRMDGFAFLRTLMERGHKTPAIVLTGFGNIAQAVSIVHELRAFWFLEKPAQQEILQTLLDRAIKYGALLHKTEILERELSYQGMLGEMVGASDCMRQVYGLIQRAAPTNASVLITGESGTGKEMVARTLHRLSARADGPFVPINCAALPADLIESELFGHEKGSFTGATGRHPGCFEQANGDAGAASARAGGIQGSAPGRDGGDSGGRPDSGGDQSPGGTARPGRPPRGSVLPLERFLRAPAALARTQVGYSGDHHGDHRTVESKARLPGNQYSSQRAGAPDGA